MSNDEEYLNKNIREDIEYFQHVHYVSMESLRKIVILQTLNKIKLNFSIDEIVCCLNNYQIEIISIQIEHLKKLEKLPILKIDGKTHDDPFDRLLIAQAITNKYTTVSSDRKFPFYKDYGLKLLVNEK